LYRYIVIEDTMSGNIPENRAPDACSLVAALHHQTTPYFVWRCFLHWAGRYKLNTFEPELASAWF
jgi:hypothetical protein